MTAHKCLIVASNFPPVHSGGVYRTLRIVKYLKFHNWDVSILTVEESTFPPDTKTDVALLRHVTNEIEVHRAPARFPLQTFKKLRRSVQPTRKSPTNPAGNPSPQPVKQSAPRQKGWQQQLKDRISLPFMTPDRLVGWVRPASKLGGMLVRKEEPDLIYSSGPPFSNHLVGLNIKRDTGCPWVADFRDPWLGNAFRPERDSNSWQGRKHRDMETATFRLADHVIFNTERSRNDAILRGGKELEAKSVVIPNGFDPDDFPVGSSDKSPSDQTELNDGRHPGPMKIVHTGAFYGRRNADAMIMAIGELAKAEEVMPRDLQVDLVGCSRPHEHEIIAANGVAEFFEVVPQVPHEAAIRRMKSADVLLLIQTEAPLCVPGKVYEYIAMRKPVLTLATDGATADLVRAEQLGPCVEPTDVASIKSELLALLEQHRSGTLPSGNRAAAERYNGKNQMAMFDAAFRAAIAGPKT